MHKALVREGGGGEGEDGGGERSFEYFVFLGVNGSMRKHFIQYRAVPYTIKKSVDFTVE